ncbi:MAG: hypothetical protein GX916_03910 [Clostridiales bacterium]|nr:hypothetical protein [Clostridiales bacterium]
MNTRKLICLLLFLALLPLTAGAQPTASFAPGINLSERFDPPHRNLAALTAFDGQVVFADNNYLYVAAPDGQTHRKPLNDFFGPVREGGYRAPAFAQDEKCLALLDTQSGALTWVDLSGGAPAPGAKVALDWQDYIADMGNYVQVEAPVQFALAGDTLYALDARGATLTRFALDTGEKLPALSITAQAIVPYRNGKLLLVQALPGPDGQETVPTLMVYDPQLDTASPAQTLAAGQLGSISYDPASDTLLAAHGDVVYAYPALNEGQPCATLPQNNFFMEYLPIAALPGQLMAVGTRDNIYLKSADAAAFAEKTPLTLLLAADRNEGLNQAANAMENVALTVRQDYLSPLEFAQMMVAGDIEHDLYWVNLSAVDFASLMKKGYAADLSGSAKLTQAHRRLYPQVQQAVSHGEGIYALPMSATGIMLLGEDSFTFDDNGQPTLRTLDDLLSYMQAWPEAMAGEHPDMVPYQGYEVQYGAHELALQTYIDSCIGTGQELSFDTPQLRQLMERLAVMDWGVLDVGNEDYAAPIVFSNEWLMSLRQFNGDGRDSHDYFPFLLSLTPDTPAVLPLEVSCVFINPRSPHQDAALEFIEALLDAMPDDARIMLHEQENTPVENPSYQQTLAEYKDLLVRKRAALDAATGGERAELKAWLQRAEQHFEDMKDTQRWLISEQNIRDYRALAAHPYVRQYNGEYLGARTALEMLSQYTGGSIDLDRFLSDIQSRLNLIRNESL